MRAFLTEQLVFLSHNGFDVTVICDDDQDFARDCPPELRYVAVHMTRGVGLRSTLVGCLRLLRLFRKERFDMVQYATPKASLISSIAGFVSGVPVRLYCQWGIRYVGFGGIPRRAFKLLEKLVCRLSTHVAPDSRGNLDFAIAEGLYLRAKGSVVHKGSANGVNVVKFDINSKQLWRADKRAEMGLVQSSFVYGFVGRITGDKGINELVRAFLQLASDDRDAFLVLVGQEENVDTLSPEVLEAIHHHSQIKSVGPKPNPQEYLAAMDVAVLPSYREGFGTVAIEAQAMGVPVITTDIPGPREAVINGETGMLVPVADHTSLLAAMRRLRRDPVLVESMSCRAVSFARDNFEQNAFWQKVLEHRMALLQQDGRRIGRSSSSRKRM